MVVTAQVLPVEVADVGAEPATAVLTVSVGVPVTAIWLIASTWNATDCEAVVWAFADAAAATTSRPEMMMLRDMFMKPPKR